MLKKQITRILYISFGIISMILFFNLGIKYSNNNRSSSVYAEDDEEGLVTTENIVENNTIQLSNVKTICETITLSIPKTTTSTTSNIITSTTTTTIEVDPYIIPTYGVTLIEAETGNIETKQKYIWDFFVSRGYNEVATSAIIGNMMCEDPTLTGSNDSKSYNDSSSYIDGIIQWDLFDKYMTWANDKGYNWYDLEGQLVHVDEMLQGSGWMQSRLDGISGTYNNCIEIYSITCEEFPTCNNVAVATVAFERGLEGSHDWSNDQDTKRINTAYAVYDKLH